MYFSCRRARFRYSPRGKHQHRGVRLNFGGIGKRVAHLPAALEPHFHAVARLCAGHLPAHDVVVDIARAAEALAAIPLGGLGALHRPAIHLIFEGHISE